MYDQGEVSVNTDPDATDMAFLLPALHASYFGRERTALQIIKASANSLVFNLTWRRPNEQFSSQIGFARVVTDCVGFGWICDFIIDGRYRRRGFGDILMRAILADKRLVGVTLNLGTRDAHAFYARHGFERCEQMMRRPM